MFSCRRRLFGLQNSPYAESLANFPCDSNAFLDFGKVRHHSMACGLLATGTFATENRGDMWLRFVVLSRSREGVQTGGASRSGLVVPFFLFFSFLVIFWDFPDLSGILPICPGIVQGFSRFVLFLFLDLFTAPTRNSPESVRDTIWNFPEKGGNAPGLETPLVELLPNLECPKWRFKIWGLSKSEEIWGKGLYPPFSGFVRVFLVIRKQNETTDTNKTKTNW